MTARPICKVCGINPRAPAYYRNDKRYFRSKCAVCHRLGKELPEQKPRWQLNGYVKKSICDLCGFKSKYSAQIVVYHIDGNLNNSALHNLRSICLCCTEVVRRRNAVWRQGDLKPD
jgi:hypothetical protein